MSLLVFLLNSFVFLSITTEAANLPGYVIISIEGCPFITVGCLLTQCREWEGELHAARKQVNTEGAVRLISTVDIMISPVVYVAKFVFLEG